MENKWTLAGGILLAVVAVSFAWSAALTFLVTGSLAALNTMEPWAAYRFLATYGVTGRAGTVLGQALVIALVGSGLLTLPLFLLRRPTWYGDARWARSGELRQAQLRADAGLVLGKKNGTLLRNAEPVHVLVAAPTRAGKGVGLVIPNLLTWPGSVVVLDIKRENYAITAGHRRQHHPVYLWAPMDAHSHRYNPFDGLSPERPQRITDLQQLATHLIPHTGRGETMWVEEARSLFLGLALLVLDDPVVPHTLGQVYRTLTSETELAEVARLALEQRERPVDPLCRRLLANFTGKADKERSGVKSTLTAALALWANPHIDAATAASDFELRDLRRNRAAVYVGVGQDQLVTLAPLLALFFQQAVATLSRALPAHDEPYEVLFLVDEFAMLGAMPTLATGLALLAGYHIRIMVIVQGLGQLEDLYHQSGTEGILQNCAVQIFFASNDDRTTHYVSNRLGTKTVPVRSRSQSHDWKTTTSTSYIARPLLAPEEVRRLNPHKAIIFKETARPVLADKIRYYADARFAACVRAPPPVPALEIPPPPLDRGEQAVAELAKLVDLDPPAAEPARAAAGSAECEAVYDAFREEMAAERRGT